MDFEKKHVEEAMVIALANYSEERQFVKDLPQVGNIPDLNTFAENRLGVAAFEKYTRLGVDFESFNPTARGFWLKYFTPYTNSVVRRIDERIIQLRV